MTLQKAGGLAALGTSGTYFILVLIFAVVIPHLGIATPGDVSNPTKGMAAVASTPAPFFIINVTYLLFGLFDVLLFLALRERLHVVSPTRMLLAAIAASIGAGLLVAAGLVSLTGSPKLVSAQDVSAYRARQTSPSLHYGQKATMGLSDTSGKTRTGIFQTSHVQAQSM